MIAPSSSDNQSSSQPSALAEAVLRGPGAATMSLAGPCTSIILAAQARISGTKRHRMLLERKQSTRSRAPALLLRLLLLLLKLPKHGQRVASRPVLAAWGLLME